MIKTIWLSYLIWLILLSILSIFLTTLIHPVTIIILILIYNITLCLNINLWKSSTLFPIIFFIIIIRGLLIIFLYFSRLISNEKTLNIFKNSIKFTLITNFLYFLLTRDYYNKSSHSIKSTNQINFLDLNLINQTPHISLIYQHPNYFNFNNQSRNPQN